MDMTSKTIPERPVALTDLVDRYLTHHRASGHSVATVKRYTHTFRLFARFLAAEGLAADITALNSATMRRFSVWLQDTPVRTRLGDTKRAPAGAHAHLRDLRAFTRWLNDEELLDRAVRVPMPRLPKRLFPILSDDELQRVWTSRYMTGRSSLAVRNRALLGLMLDTGLRREEVASLTLDSLDRQNCLLTVIGKGDKERRVPYSTGVARILDEWISRRGSEAGPLFWLTGAGVRTVFRKIQVELGLEHFHPHQLRHQAATMMVRSNVDLESVRRILGHTDISTTSRYLSMSDADLRAKHAVASPFETLAIATRVPEQRRRRLSLADD